MTIVTINYGPYDFHGRIKYRYIRLKGLIKLLTAANIPFQLKRFHFWDRVNVEIEGQTVYKCRLSNMEFDGDGNDYTSATAFVIIRDAYYSVLKYYKTKDKDRILYPKHTGAKCFPASFDSFYLESFCRYSRKPGILFDRSLRDEVEEVGEISGDEEASHHDFDAHLIQTPTDNEVQNDGNNNDEDNDDDEEEEDDDLSSDDDDVGWI